jgi:GNAT superfamily N-acetyltransferase
VSTAIREATEADVGGILELYAQPGVDDGAMLPLDEARRLFAKFKTYPDYCIYVAVDGDEIVGTFAMAIMDNLGHLGAPSALVEDVAVRPDRQGRGIGKQMMWFAMECARAARCYKLALSSNLKRDAAHAFYHSLGFQRHGHSFLVTLDSDEEHPADEEQQ